MTRATLAGAALLLLASCSRDSAQTSARIEPAPGASASASASASAPAPGSGPASASASASAPASESASASASAPASASAAPPASGSSASATTSTPPGQTRLLDPGQPPRRKLRYAWRAEQKERLAMTLRTAATADLGGARQEFPLPPVHIVVDVDPVAVTPDGDMRYAWRVTSAVVTADAQSMPAMVQGMRAEVAAVEHLSGTGAVTARGLSRGVTIDPASVVDGGAGTTGQMVEQVSQTLRDAAVPFPEEEVGKGARWQRVAQLGGEGAARARLTQTDTFTLVDLQGDRGTVDDALAQSAPSQPLRGPGGAQARVESLLASGQARSQFDRTRLVAQTRFEGTTTMVVSGSAGSGGAQRGTMTMRLGFDVEGTVR